MPNYPSQRTFMPAGFTAIRLVHEDEVQASPLPPGLQAGVLSVATGAAWHVLEPEHGSGGWEEEAAGGKHGPEYRHQLRLSLNGDGQELASLRQELTGALLVAITDEADGTRRLWGYPGYPLQASFSAGSPGNAEEGQRIGLTLKGRCPWPAPFYPAESTAPSLAGVLQLPSGAALLLPNGDTITLEVS